MGRMARAQTESFLHLQRWFRLSRGWWDLHHWWFMVFKTLKYSIPIEFTFSLWKCFSHTVCISPTSPEAPAK